MLLQILANRDATKNYNTFRVPVDVADDPVTPEQHCSALQSTHGDYTAIASGETSADPGERVASAASRELSIDNWECLPYQHGYLANETASQLSISHKEMDDRKSQGCIIQGVTQIQLLAKQGLRMALACVYSEVISNTQLNCTQGKSADPQGEMCHNSLAADGEESLLHDAIVDKIQTSKE